MKALLKHYTFVDYATQIYSALVLLLILFFHNHTVAYWPWYLAAHLLGLGLIHLLIEVQAAHRNHKLLDLLRYFYPVLLYTAFFCETGHLNRMFFTNYLDGTVAGWDQALFGCQPGVVFMSKLPWLPVSELFYAAYFSYYLMIGGLGLALFLRNREQFFHFVSVISFVFYICYLLYIFLPVIGPQTLIWPEPGIVLPLGLQKLPAEIACPEALNHGLLSRLMSWIYEVFESPGAAFPSSHVAIALCTVFFSFRYLRPIRYLHLAVVVLLCLSILYCHYHYGVDLLGGILTAAILLPLGNWLYVKFEGRIPKAEGNPNSENPKENNREFRELTRIS